MTRSCIQVLVLSLAISAPFALAADPGLGGGKTVYLLPMTGGLDQYLANRLTLGNRLQVVADPAIADLIMTDRLGESFQTKMAELYPAPDADPDEKETGWQRVSSFRSSKGNIFLVDRKSKRVVWSIYERPRNLMPDELNRTAQRIVKKLEGPSSTPKEK